MRIFHRIDDVCAWTPEVADVLDFFAQTVREFVVAAIPRGFSDSVASRLREYGNCCVYQHGHSHINRVSSGWCDEFPDAFPAEKTRAYIRDGKSRLEDLLQREVKGYVPPWNNTGVNVIRILDELGFEVYSAQKNNTMPFKSNRDIDVDVVESYLPAITYRPFSNVFEEVKKVASQDGEIGILYHFKNAGAENLSGIFDFVKEVESFQAVESGEGVSR